MLEIGKVHQGDCLELMKAKELIRLYNEERWTLRMIAKKFNTNHHLIKRKLEREGIKITRRNSLKEFTQKHKDNISKSCKGRVCWWKGKKMPKEHSYKNMKVHLKYDVTLEWLKEFEDIEKLKYLNRSIRDCKGFTTEIYKLFIKKFYNDEKFNTLFEKWKITKDKWIKPSLDHIKAKSNGGTSLLDNLQFISWLENRAKMNIDQTEWNSIKTKINEYF